MPKGDRGRDNYATRKLFDPRQSASAREFRGIDGEGGNVAEPGTLFGTRHQYLSLRAGEYLLETGNPLRYDDCFTFLTKLPSYRINVAYFFDYDVTMMIRTMPEERATRLLKRHLRVNAHGGIMPLDFDGWQIEYLPHKEFRVRDVSDGNDRAKWFTINDTGQFFQGSFLSTLKKWNIGTESEQAFIKRGKEMRSDFAEVTDETRAYNALECVLLEQLMAEFRQVCEETGYVPKKWQGPGYLASAMLDAHSVPRRDDIPILSNDSFRMLAQAAYYGGRFETTAIGPIPGPVYQYDINGAYVALLRSLPCLLHGTWRQVHSRPRSGLWFGEVDFNHDKQRCLYNLPVRRHDGSIYYPKMAHGVYWSSELEAAERAGTSIQFVNGWVYSSKCDCRWFDFVDDYYKRRLALGKTNKGYVLKLAGNSIYGKLAQSIGYAPWANPVWAGLITAGCRAMLIDAYSQVAKYEDEKGENCVMLATDGLFMMCPLNLPTSKNLGEWELTVHENGMFIVQPGVYFLEDDAKTRGVEKGRISNMRAEFDAAFEEQVRTGVYQSVKVKVDNFVTAKQAINRGKWELAGTWSKDDREITLATHPKRSSGVMWWSPHATGKNFLRTFALPPQEGVVSVPYDRVIGGGLNVAAEDRYVDVALQEGERIAEQPDWVEPLFDRD